MAKTFVKIMYSVDDHDRDGDVVEEGIYLHFGGCRVWVAQDMKAFRKFRKRFDEIAQTIETKHGGDHG